VLARLNSIPGVAEANVEATGRHFLLVAGSGGNSSDISRKALEILGSDSHRLAADCEEEEIADFSSGGLWFQVGTLLQLSYLEARILAERWGGAAASDSGLQPESAASFATMLRCELARCFARIHTQGGTEERNWYLRDFPDVFAHAISRAGGSITAEQAEALRAALLRLLRK
jgi:hypothetical protein